MVVHVTRPPSCLVNHVNIKEVDFGKLMVSLLVRKFIRTTVFRFDVVSTHV